MILKKMFYKFKINRFSKMYYHKYIFEVFISNNKSIVYEYPYYTLSECEEIVQNIFKNGLKIDNWFINNIQIESMKLIRDCKYEVYINNDDIYTDLDDNEIKSYNDKYNKYLELYKTN